MFGKKTKASLAFVRESLAAAQEDADVAQHERDGAVAEANRVRAELRDLENVLFTHPRSPIENLATRVRELLEKERVIDEFRAMCAGNYNADAALLRKLACALGTSHLNTASVIARADQLVAVRTENLKLQGDLLVARERIDDLEDRELEASFPDFPPEGG